MRNAPTPSAVTVTGVEYAVATQTLDVSFADGCALRYHRVPWSVYEAVRSAGSMTELYLTRVRGRFAYSLIEAYRMAA